MFDISTSLAAGAALISGYGKGEFTVAGQTHSGNLIITAGGFVGPLQLSLEAGAAEVSISAALESLEAMPEILLLGTGATHQFMPPSIRQSIKTRYGVGVDTMDTGAACRTYNVLASEGRSVAAFLMAI